MPQRDLRQGKKVSGHETGGTGPGYRIKAKKRLSILSRAGFVAFIAHRAKRRGSGQNYGVNIECTVPMIFPACCMHVSASSSVNAASGVISGNPLG
jgi:hypothetical protein